VKNPVFYSLVRLAARRQLRRQGYSLWQVNEMMAGADDGLVDAAQLDAGVVIPIEGLGDGTILKAIIEFLQSEQGQALIAALVKMLLMLIAV
jgi:hypothetical protein